MSIEPSEPPDSTLARFDPMLRALVTFGLVERDGAGVAHGDRSESGWHLIPAVQRRLESLVVPAPAVDKIIYFGHRCSSCGERGPTKMRAGEFVCEACANPPASAQHPSQSSGRGSAPR